ncbi:MAG: hypothetical protein KKC80_01095 [Candidatus Margulisbacteria bacterium]|nr:hypothetical protein [Candidatus Margulisiibacteriota bacterium]MBU1616471.1 hypothetical protein [Candidatus Margulisiibacteriota bacterium]MBU1867391.1 hypothetical protein [Candidatus Margulisiibacteriota bacterium]
MLGQIGDDGPVTITPDPSSAPVEEISYGDDRKTTRAVNLVKEALRRLEGHGGLSLKIQVDANGRLTLKSATGAWHAPGSDAIPESRIRQLLGNITFPTDLRGHPVITFTVPLRSLTQGN